MNNFINNSYELELKKLYTHVDGGYVNEEEKQRIINTVEKHKPLFKKMCDFVSENSYISSKFTVRLDTKEKSDYTLKLALDFFFPTPFDKYIDYLVMRFLNTCDPLTVNLNASYNWVFKPKGVFIYFSFGSLEEFDNFQKTINKLNEEFAVYKELNVKLLRTVEGEL